MEMYEETFPERLMMKTYDESGEVITEWDESLGWFEDGTEQNEYGEWIMNRIFHPYTEEQLAEKQIENEKVALAESRRPLSLEEVTSLLVKMQVNTVDIPDQTSLRMIDYYPAFEDVSGETVKGNFKFVYEGKLWKTTKEMQIQSQYPPGIGMESLYSRIDLEHTGAVYDPIPYDGNMELFAGKYYTQNDVIYLCARDTGAAVYHALSELVGLYVEEWGRSQ